MTNQGTDQPWGLKWIGHPAFALVLSHKVNVSNRMAHKVNVSNRMGRELPDEVGDEATS